MIMETGKNNHYCRGGGNFFTLVYIISVVKGKCVIIILVHVR